MTKNILAIDTETHLFKPYDMAPPVVCLSWATTIKDGLMNDKELIEAWMTDHLRMAIQQKIVIIGHHIAYDMACLIRSFPNLWNLVFDAYDKNGIVCTKVREKLLDIANDEFKHQNTNNGKKKTGYSLAELSERRLGKHLEKENTWRLRYAELDNVPLEQWPEDAKSYAIDDSVTCLKVYQNQEERAKRINYSIPTQYHDSRADFALKLMSVWGVVTDTDYVKQRWNETSLEMLSIARELEKTKILSLKEELDLLNQNELRSLPNTKKSDKVIRQLVEKSFPGDPPRTDGGKVKANDDTIQMCSHPSLKNLQKFKSLEKAANTYLKHFLEPIIHAYFDAVGAVSDRTSCSNPNLQNLPRVKGFRECFVPRTGFKYLTCDFDSHEMRTLAQACLDTIGHSKLAEEFKKNPKYKPHQDFAYKIGSTEQQAKVANFGYPGGLGPKNFVNYARGWGLDISFEASKKLQKAWFNQWTEMKDYFRHVESLVGSEDYGTQVIKRSGFRRKGVDYKQASNGYFSTLAAHGSKDALWEVTLACYAKSNSPLYGCRPCLYIHDEIGLEARVEQCEEAKKEIERLMVGTMKKWTPDVPSSASAKCMERWSK